MKKVIKLKARIAEKEVKQIFIDTDFIRLDAALKLCGRGGLGRYRKNDNSGRVEVVSQRRGLRSKRGKKLHGGDEFSFDGKYYEVVKNDVWQELSVADYRNIEK